MLPFLHNPIESIRPMFVTLISALTISGNAAVWLDAIKGWAAVFTVALGAPTAVLVLVYWVLKVRYEWRNRNKRKE